MNPLAIPKMMIPNQSLKKAMKTYETLGARTMMAKKVEKPPWNTEEPIFPKALLALITLGESFWSSGYPSAVCLADK